MQKLIPIAALLAAVTVAGALWRGASVPPGADSVSRTPQSARIDLAGRWQVEPEIAAALVARGATLLDARSWRWPWDPLSAATAIDWRDFSDRSAPQRRGHLHPDDRRLAAELQALGIDRERAVVVVGDPRKGWGEDGRIVWMLRSLGHPRVVMVNGGYQALARAIEGPLQQQPAAVGSFAIARSPQWTLEKEDLRALSARGEGVILDARSPAEYAGAVRYGETRGGHVPGAKSLHFREWIGPDGRVLPRSQIEAHLQALGISPDTPVAIYCTGGVRSAWLTAILVDLGYNARNYAGSMWEWSAAAPEAFPLVRDRQEAFALNRARFRQVLAIGEAGR